MASLSLNPARLFALSLACTALICGLSGSAFANSRLCRQLESDLAATYGARPASSQARKQDAAIARQRDQLQLARKRSRQSGCGFSLFGRKDAKCAAVNGKIEKMERNLEALERRRSAVSRGGSGKSRASLLAALEANGCRDSDVATRRLPRGLDGSKNLLDQIFGGGIRSRRSLDELSGSEPTSRDARSGGLTVLKPRDGEWVNEGGHLRFSAPPGQYRTLCVRTCDGYFFPMSNASSPMDFDRDQKNCESSCPETEVQLYYHRALSEESEDMISPGSGMPYSELPTAYLYKQTGVPQPASCSCGKPRDFRILDAKPADGTSPRDPAASPSSIVSLGTPKPQQAATPTLPDAREEEPREPTEAEKKVRVVGPTFLPDQGSAEDPQAPDRTQVQ